MQLPGRNRSLPVVVLPGWRPASYPCRVASNAETSKVVPVARKTNASGRITNRITRPHHPLTPPRAADQRGAARARFVFRPPEVKVGVIGSRVTDGSCDSVHTRHPESAQRK